MQAIYYNFLIVLEPEQTQLRAISFGDSLDEVMLLMVTFAVVL